MNNIQLELLIKDLESFTGWVWLSTKSFTVRVDAKNGIITESAPIIWRYKGYPIWVLIEDYKHATIKIYKEK